MEPERKIEKLLRAYARKRRAAAGEPLKVDPATRRLLQDEISRSTSKPEAEETWLSLWQLFRQQWAFLLGFTLMIFLGATLLLPTLRSAKREAQSISSMNNLRQIGTAAQIAAARNRGKLPWSLDALTNELLSPRALIDPTTGKPYVYAAAGKNLDELQSNNILAYSPASKAGSAVLFADGRVEYADRARLVELTNQKDFQLALANKITSDQIAKKTSFAAPVAVAPPAMLPAAGAAGQQSGATSSRSLNETGAVSSRQDYRNEAVPVQNMPVLQSFLLLQKGDSLSVIDHDGSVYRGSVQAASATRNNEPASAQAPMPAAAPQREQAKQVRLAGIQQQAAQNYFFRVAGMNRTLKQNVVFSGSMETVPGQQPGINGTAGEASGGVAAAQTNVQAAANQQQWLLSNLRVVGTALIGPTNRISINAVPVTP